MLAKGRAGAEATRSSNKGLRSFEDYHNNLMAALRQSDTEIYGLVGREYRRLANSIQLIAAENQCSRAVLATLGSIVQNKTTEGFPGARFHGGCEIVDDIERLAIERAKQAFGAKYANVQPHSGTQANQIVLTAILEKGDRILSLGMDQGGHVSHGAVVAMAGKFFDVQNYSVEKDTYSLDYDKIREQALALRPRLIICGATAYARILNFSKFRQIADEVGAYLMADISHIAGLVIAGVHPSPVDWAHFTTTSTYKPGGPRGGLILMGKDFEQRVKLRGREVFLWQCVEKTTFPGVQGTPYLNHIAAKAVFFREAMSQEYRERHFRIVENAKRLAERLFKKGWDVVSGGTDNHMVLVNVANSVPGLTGVISQKALEDCSIVVNMNKLPYDTRKASVTSGMRLGTPIVTRQGMGPEQMDDISDMVDAVLRNIQIRSETQYEIEDSFKIEMRKRAKDICEMFPLQ